MVTYYTVNWEECGKTNGITASGVKVRDGMVAADWRKYSPGTLLYNHTTHEIWVVGDRGGAIKRNRIDKHVWTKKEAIRLGIRKNNVSVLYKPNKSKQSVTSKVQQSFKLRNQILNSLPSRGGYDNARLLLQQSLLKTTKNKTTDPKETVIVNKKNVKHFSKKQNTVSKKTDFKKIPFVIDHNSLEKHRYEWTTEGILCKIIIPEYYDARKSIPYFGIKL